MLDFVLALFVGDWPAFEVLVLVKPPCSPLAEAVCEEGEAAGGCIGMPGIKSTDGQKSDDAAWILSCVSNHYDQRGMNSLPNEVQRSIGTR